MRDAEMAQILGVPYSTVGVWKKRPPTDWRKRLYTYLSLKTPEELQAEMHRVDTILSLTKPTA